MRLVQFTSTWSKFTPGEVHGFDPKTAKALIDEKRVAKPWGPVAAVLEISVSTEQAEQSVADALQALAVKSEELDIREARVVEAEQRLKGDV